MNILHIACTNGDMCNGVQVVVPQHLIAQSEFENIGFINLSNIEVRGFNNQFYWKNDYSLNDLPAPFNYPNLVVFHEAYRKEYLKISAHLRKNSIPYVIIPHGELSNGAQKKKALKKKIANILLFNHFINNSLAIQCLSQNELKSTNFGKTKFVGTNGISLPNISKENFSIHGVKFVYIGRLDIYHKGLDLMLESFANVKELLKDKNCSLTIYGPNIKGRLEKLEELVKSNGLEDFITLKKEVFDNEKQVVLLNSDIFIQSSRFEGMPMGILEAMSYGIPCFVTEGTTLGNIIGEYDAGWIAQTDVNSITNKLVEIISGKKELDKYSQNSRRAVTECFEWSVIAKKTIGEYKKLMQVGE